jgi:hypothetical protein
MPAITAIIPIINPLIAGSPNCGIYLPPYQRDYPENYQEDSDDGANG